MNTELANNPRFHMQAMSFSLNKDLRLMAAGKAAALAGMECEPPYGWSAESMVWQFGWEEGQKAKGAL